MISYSPETFIIRFFNTFDITSLNIQVPSDGSGVAFQPGTVVPTSAAQGSIIQLMFISYSPNWWVL